MMNSQPYIIGFIFGSIGGLYYFYGLLLTVRRVPVSRHPTRLLVMSYLIRLFPVLLGMIFIARINPGMLITFLVGFFMVRFILTRSLSENGNLNINRGILKK
ncbi:MAG: ATP synthase subunit I [Proteobacteria bacterium]|nr:ATP synthase subunit I [Pseudomonadota bacterium]MBU1711291.1 ATP synthase subunit I [Pseudomonadota bacterium]